MKKGKWMILWIIILKINTFAQNHQALLQNLNNRLQKNSIIENTSTMPDTNMFPILLKLTILLGGLLLSYFIAKAYFANKSIKTKNQAFFKILDKIPVANKKNILVVDMIGSIFLIAETESSMNLITEITDENKQNLLRNYYEKSNDSFQELLTQSMDNIKSNTSK